MVCKDVWGRELNQDTKVQDAENSLCFKHVRLFECEVIYNTDKCL